MSEMTKHDDWLLNAEFSKDLVDSFEEHAVWQYISKQLRIRIDLIGAGLASANNMDEVRKLQSSLVESKFMLQIPSWLRRKPEEREDE